MNRKRFLYGRTKKLFGRGCFLGMTAAFLRIPGRLPGISCLKKQNFILFLLITKIEAVKIIELEKNGIEKEEIYDI